ncbi:MAG: DMT family transporter [Candidatus Woesearchaeota archaeon]
MDQNKGLALVLSTAIISGFSIFINKFGVAGINPDIFTLLKNAVVAVLFLSAFLLFRNFPRISKKQWGQLTLVGLLGGSIPFILFFRGLQLTSAASASFIHKTMFIWVSILSVILLKNRLDKKSIALAIILLLGNFLVLNLSSFSFGKGELLILAATLLWSIETIISKSALKTIDSKTVAFGRMFFGSAFILAFLMATGNFTLALSVSQLSWIGITSIFLFFYVFTWYSGLQAVDPVVATSILLLGSPVTTLLDFLYTHQVNPVQMLGSLIIVSGVILLTQTHRTSMANPR